ncbi:cytochrome p450 [Diplodia corticola]|uniref:Cytochrome p450 n=1 Tax=Diplodia corticola TaxID=236234 RepID=A0A1J9RII8_9PEZI|nr:cytochrome p450 [Diplodia corticola]OJD40273.1 cytochrome p450 [Diplodia corticola]
MGYVESLAITYGNVPFLLVGSLLLFYFITCIVRDPLRHVPGPLICRFTSLWLHYHAWAGTQCSAIQKLHEELGPVVRIGPNDVHMSDGDALWPIYMEKGGFVKSDYYSTFNIDGHATIFTTLSLEKRSARLKSIQPLFSHASCMAAKGIIEKCATRMVERIAEGRQTRKPVDVLNLARSYAIDAVSSYILRAPYNGLEEQGEMSASPFVDYFVSMSRFFHLSQSQMHLIERIMEFVAPDAKTTKSTQIVDGFLKRTIEEKITLLEERKGDDSYPSRLLALGVPKEKVIAECKDAVFAGTDSTGNNLATIIWYLVAQPDKYARLRTELHTNATSAAPKDLQSLPYLSGVIKEALRLSMAISTRLPRVVPAGGYQHNGTYLPPATVVGLSAYQLHLNPAVYPEPRAFRPERWVEGAGEERMQRDFMPFGKGARACIARNLAMLELYVATAAVVEAGVLEGGGARTVRAEIECLEWFNARVKGGVIEIVWPEA